MLTDEQIQEMEKDLKLLSGGQWEILPLEGKYYGTQVALGEHCIVTVWGHRTGTPSQRELKAWGGRWPCSSYYWSGLSER